MDGLTDWQLQAMAVTERVNSCVSLAGIFFVILTYLFAPGFDKPINRLIFFASFGNMGSNVASLISEAGPMAGPASALCQAQAFLVQMFLGVDCYWAFCMAVNVYLVFFRGFNTMQLRALDIWYLLLCYGLAFIPAIVFVFVNTADRGRVYGPAIIWCWITTDWDWMRIVFLYGIVWVAIIVAFVVYAMAGKVIWDKRRHLKGFLNPLNENPFSNTIITEIEITHEERPIIKEAGGQGISDPSSDADAYSVQIHTEAQRANHALPAALRMRSVTRDAALGEANAEACLYARVAFLFFLALLITWVPSSINRGYALDHPGVVNFSINYVACFVFPLQGFWNVIVYIITSQTACRRLWDSCFSSAARRHGHSGPNLTGGSRNNRQVMPGKQHRLQSFSSV